MPFPIRRRWHRAGCFPTSLIHQFMMRRQGYFPGVSLVILIAEPDASFYQSGRDPILLFVSLHIETGAIYFYRRTAGGGNYEAFFRMAAHIKISFARQLHPACLACKEGGVAQGRFSIEVHHGAVRQHHGSGHAHVCFTSIICATGTSAFSK